jgi:hypothetical protein
MRVVFLERKWNIGSEGTVECGKVIESCDSSEVVALIGRE